MKIVNEPLYKFEKKSNPLVSLGVGKINQITKWLHEMEIKNYTINDDLTIDVLEDVYLDYKNIIKFPEYIQFNKVDGYFSCDSTNLISLRGCPKIINFSFYCNNNMLTSLEGCPEIILRGDFHCQRNKIKFTIEDVSNLCKVEDTIYV